MKNKDIIREAAIKAGIITEKEAAELENAGTEIPFHTASGWRQKGYSVREGESGVEVKLWKRKETGEGFYLAKAYLYSFDQVEEEGNPA